MTRPIRVLELRSVLGTGGGPDKTILASARRHTDDVALTVCYLRLRRDAVFPIGGLAKDLGEDYVEIQERYSLDPAIWPAVRSLVRNRGIDIVHGHEYKTDAIAYALSKAEPVVPIATAHGWTGHLARERWLYYPSDKWLLTRFPKVIAVSREIRRTLIRAGASEDRVEVVLNGIDAERFRRVPAARPAARQRLSLTSGDFAIGAVGRLEPQKRFDLLIAVFADVRRQFPNVRLLIAGDGSLRETLLQQINHLGLQDAVTLTGHVEVIPFHHALDLFVQSSDYEGTPNVVLEAMALESPIVATDVGGTHELAKDGVHAIIVPPNDAPRLREAVVQAITDPAGREARGLAARQRVEGELSFDRRMARVNAIYAELLESVSGARARRRRRP